jgi:poly(3-hydroxybutyrate) depolymerase
MSIHKDHQMPVNSLRLSLFLALSALTQSALAAAPLPAIGADKTQTSVSGLSSGAFMAVQYQVAYSASVKGAGIVAGGPYYCAAAVWTALTSACMGNGIELKPAQMANQAREFAKHGLIDPLSSLQNARIYLFSGTRDDVVKPSAVKATVDFFKLAGVRDSNVKYVNTVAAQHAFIAPTFGNPCTAKASPYINQCPVGKDNYDQAGALLQHIYGSLTPPAKILSATVQPFDQSAFAPEASDMAKEAFVYIPKTCSTGAACKVHIALHGCKQSAAEVGDAFYAHAGYNNWADSNRIVVLYPQIKPAGLFSTPLNPNGCWDWYGYTGPDYALKSAKQMVAIKAMVDRLTAMH